VILSIIHGDWGDNGCFGRCGYLGIERLVLEEGLGRGNGLSGVGV
jgi:hypothetical protein